MQLQLDRTLNTEHWESPVPWLIRVDWISVSCQCNQHTHTPKKGSNSCRRKGQCACAHTQDSDSVSVSDFRLQTLCYVNKRQTVGRQTGACSDVRKRAWLPDLWQHPCSVSFRAKTKMLNTPEGNLGRCDPCCINPMPCRLLSVMKHLFWYGMPARCCPHIACQQFPVDCQRVLLSLLLGNPGN